MFSFKSIVRGGLRAAITVLFIFSISARAQDVLHVYGPDGPAPAMKEAAAAFEKKTGIKVDVADGPLMQWVGKAKNDADLVYSGSEVMMNDFVNAMDGQLSLFKVTPLYLRPYSILVRPGNPKHIRGVQDILKPGIKVMVVNGAGMKGVWEDMAGRKGDIKTVIALRKNIAFFAKNSDEAKPAWINNKDIDVWLTWNIRQVPNPQLADMVPIERDYVIYRNCGIAITRRAESKPAAKSFVDFLQSADGAEIFAKWGWKAEHK